MKKSECLCVVVRLNDSTCLLRRVLLEIVITIQHAQRHDGTDSPDSLHALDGEDGGVEGLEGVVEECVQISVVVQDCDTLHVMMMFMNHYDN